MDSLTVDGIRRSMINCSKGDAKRMTIARHIDPTDLEHVEFLGWRDPRIPQRAYLVALDHDSLIGVLLRPATGGARRTAMCALCRTTRTDGQISLHTAPRAGAAGRDGNSVGTYICDDLACPRTTRLERAPDNTVTPDLSQPLPERTAGLRTRLHAFINNIRTPTA